MHIAATTIKTAYILLLQHYQKLQIILYSTKILFLKSEMSSFRMLKILNQYMFSDFIYIKEQNYINFSVNINADNLELM